MDATSSRETQAVVSSAIAEISHIATLPEITLKIIELVEDPNSTAHDLHNIISNDPALCSRILKVVNSAFYGLPRQIGSINRAIPLDASGELLDGRTFTGLAGLRRVLMSRPEEFVRPVTEKLLAYALGREVRYYDMPVVRGIVRDAASTDYRWSSIMLGIVQSAPFQMKQSIGDAQPPDKVAARR